jgi:hypothetical protein
MSSVVNTALSVGNIIGIVIGVLSGIAMIVCCLVTICCYCKKKNRNNVWADRSPPPYYSNDRNYEQTVSTSYYGGQPMNTFDEKY